MKITFVLPYTAEVPGGGVRIIYEYANRLANIGHSINLIHPVEIPYFKYRSPLFLRYLKRYVLDLKHPKWFSFNKGVSSYLVPKIKDNFIPHADIIVATWWATSYEVAKLNSFKGVKFYFIQHYETWIGHEDLVKKSYNIGLINIVIAKWLQSKLEENNAKVKAYIPNAINLEKFKLIKEIQGREQKILMLYSNEDWKGCSDGIKAINKIRTIFPSIKVAFFGIPPRNSEIPEYVEYYQNPPQNQLVELYNSSSIYLCPSWTEGWTLPPAEALACGCALISTNIDGVSDYAIDKETALLGDIKSPESLFKLLKVLIEDDNLRINLATNGYKYIQNFKWDNSVKKLESAFLSEL